MNSAEQKDFEHVLPARKEIQKTISFITQRLQAPEMSDPQHLDLKEGYEAAADMLEHDKKTFDQIPDNLLSVRSKAIAVLAVNYLNGECSRNVLLGFGNKE